MGAATALMYGSQDPSIACLICDSPFSSLIELSGDLCNSPQVNSVCIFWAQFQQLATKSNTNSRTPSDSASELGISKFAFPLLCAFCFVTDADDNSTFRSINRNESYSQINTRASWF